MSIYFSVITVVLNDKNGLVNTKDSLFIQDFKDYEWIVIDGGSEDGTIEFLQNEEPENVTWVSRKDDGIYDAMNKGLRLCKGKYIVFMNAGDCFYNYTILSQVYKKIKQQKIEPDVIFGGAELLLPNNNTYYRKVKKFSKIIWHGLPAVHQATYYSRNALVNFQYDLGYKVCGDYYIAVYLFINNATDIYINSPLVIFSVGGFSFSARNRNNLFFEPYQIQKDLLKSGFLLRILSLLKRSVSTIGINVLSKGISSQSK